MARGYTYFYGNSNIVAILVKKFPKFETIATYIDQAGTILLIDIKLNDKAFVIGNIYVLKKDKHTFFDAFFSTVVNFSKHYWC